MSRTSFRPQLEALEDRLALSGTPIQPLPMIPYSPLPTIAQMTSPQTPTLSSKMGYCDMTQIWCYTWSSTTNSYQIAKPVFSSPMIQTVGNPLI